MQWAVVARRYVRLCALLLAAVSVVPLYSKGQSNRIPRIGFLQSYPSTNDLRFEAFRKQLGDLGYTEGTTVTLEYLSAEGKYDQLPALAVELTRRHVNIIVADGGTPSAFAAI